MESLLSLINTDIFKILAVIFIIVFVISLIKKAVKLAFFVAAVVLIFSLFSTSIDKIQEKYTFEVKNGAITFFADDEEYTIADINEIENVVINQYEHDKINVTIKYSEKDISVKIPEEFKEIFIKKLEKYDIDYTENLDIHNN